jgi:hypothetical protein
MDSKLHQLIQDAVQAYPNWEIQTIQIDEKKKQIDIHIEISKSVELTCPICDQKSSQNMQTEPKTFRYFSIFGYQAFFMLSSR